MQYWISLSLILIVSFCWAIVPDPQQEQLGEAYFAAHDYSQAARFYENGLANDMQNWQRALANYNLSTISVVENRWKEIFTYIGKISFDSISSPTLLEKLVLNQSLAFFLAALATKNIVQSHYYLGESLNGLKVMEKIHCRIQKLESPLLEKCRKSPAVISLFPLIGQEQQRLQQKQRDRILSEADLYTSLNIMEEGFNRLLELFQLSETNNEKTYGSLLESSAEGLLPLWKSLREQSLGEIEKKEIEAAVEIYLEAIKLIQNEKQEGALKAIKASKRKIDTVRSKLDPDTLAMDHLLLSYKLALNQKFLNLGSMEKLLENQKKILVSSDKQTALTASTDYLQKGINQLQEGKEILGRFYLLAAFYKIPEVLSKESIKDNPEKSLITLIDQTSRALAMSHLSNQQKEPSIKEEMYPLIKEDLMKILETANSFIGIVLNAERERFQKIGVIEFSRCQDKPWDQIIPLFEEGYDHVKWAEDESVKEINLQTIQNLEVALLVWQKALDLLKNWNKFVNEQTDQLNETNAFPANMQEIFQSMQEMYLDDSAPQNIQKEFHAW